MKKLFLSSFYVFCLTPTYALTLVETGQTKVELTGSLRVNVSGSSTRTEFADGTTQRVSRSPAFTNDSSRFGFKLTQNLMNGFYAVGNVEWRFRGTSDSRHNFDDIYTRQLNAGIGHLQYGELLYGNILSIADEVRRTDLANDLTISYPLLPALHRRILQYTNAIDPVRIGIFYGGESKRNGLGLDLTNHRKNVWGTGIIYTHQINESNSIKISSGLVREQFYHRQAGGKYTIQTYAVGASYIYRDTTIAIDWEQRKTKDQIMSHDKRLENDIRFALVQQLTPRWRVYGQYGRSLHKFHRPIGSHTRETGYRYTIGTDYFVIPQYVRAFVEFRQDYRKHYTNQIFQRKVKEQITAVGVRVYW
ncbi:porin [Pelistega ratti]|uniref:porin n=1 Tax=Pelistega ratti TaxID=2652177 RepID=UPI0013587CAF|nr:porin [Pelistega ratti]